MRNMICLSLICFGTFGFADEPTELCFHRQYTDQHLVNHPRQTVAELTISIDRFVPGQTYNWSNDDAPQAKISALMASTPLTEAADQVGERFGNVLMCATHTRHPNDADWVRPGALHCAVECDGGFFEVLSVDANELLIRTEGVRLTDRANCGGPARLKDDVDGPTTYKLFAAAPELCATMHD